MGARNFVETIVSTSAEEGFKELYQEANNNFGKQDGYSGRINSTCLRGCYFRDQYSKPGEDAARKIIEDKMDQLQKGECGYIELTGYQWQILTVSKISYKHNSKFKIKYNIYSCENDAFITRADCKSEAADMAFRYTLSTGEQCYWRKEYSLIEGNSLMGQTVIEKKECKTKPNKKLKENQRLIQYNKYIYFGEAPE